MHMDINRESLRQDWDESKDDLHDLLDKADRKADDVRDAVDDAMQDGYAKTREEADRLRDKI